ncbi:alpha/beta fold hydrolase [Brevundimonas sp. GCM10030266]|uniref:alpha/beta fold hydrolase n=1 Tax=Brevundimonas sp. GCM10030266 TaxID=3273386 RepID=UPI00361F71F5
MLRPLLLAGLLLAAAPVVHAQEPAHPTYGPRLEGYEYPFPVRTFAFTSQRQALEMTYVDVAPTTAPNGRTIVLLHGKNFCAATWAPTIEVLAADGYRVIAVDQIGFCKSSKPEAWQFSLSQLAGNTRALLDSLDIERPIIMGHSMGGMLGIRYALQNPDAVSRLVLVNPIGLEDWQAEGVPYARLDAAFEGERRTTFDSIKTYQRRFYYDGDWQPRYDEPVAMLAGMYAGPGGEIVAWNQAQTSDMIFTQPVVHELPNLRVPTLLFIGELDRTAPGAARATPEVQARLGRYDLLGRRTVDAIPEARLIAFPDLGHSPQVEAPDAFHAALLAALGSAR